MQPKHCSHSFPITRSTWGSSQKNWAGHALISTNMPQPKKRYSLRSTVALIVLWSMILWLRLQARSSQMLNLRMSGHVPVARHPEFLRYQSILIPIIETNTSLDRLVEFKKNFALMNESIRTLLRKHLSCAQTKPPISLCVSSIKRLRYSITSIAPSRWPKLCVLLLAAYRGQFRGCLHELRRDVPQSSFAIKKVVPSA